MLIELLRRGAFEAPAGHPAVISADRSTTYADCLRHAEELSRGLTARSITRFACRVDDVGALIALLGAASAVGAEACVYPAAADEAQVRELAAAFDHEIVLADGDLPGLAGADGVAPTTPEASPVLILTTGTTGRPKAARHDWSRLVAGVRDRDPEPHARWLLAYNPNQFGGMQVLLHVLATQATLVVPRTRQPDDALASMQQNGVTHVSATPTFWRLVASRLDDASARHLAVEQITIGGEAVPAPLLERLARLFPGARVSQIYAGTEFGTAVSVRDGRAGLPLSVLDRTGDAETQFRIVDGELQIRSNAGMLGYHGDLEAAQDWRPTGDLVEVRGDRIQFIGRTSDIINVGGAKVHPLPIEEAVAGVDGVRLARVYGRANPITGEVVAVDVVAEPDVDTDALGGRIRAACADLPAAAQPRRVRFLDDLEVHETKIARRAHAGS